MSSSKISGESGLACSMWAIKVSTSSEGAELPIGDEVLLAIDFRKVVAHVIEGKSLVNMAVAKFQVSHSSKPAQESGTSPMRLSTRWHS